MRHELLFFTVIEETSSTSKLQSGHIWSVELKNKGFCPGVPILTCLCVTNASDGSQESSRRAPSHCQILYVYKSAVPFFCADLVCPCGWRHLPGLILPFSDGRMHAPRSWKTWGRADAFWQLRQAREMAAGCPWRCWVPPPCSLCTREKSARCTCMYSRTSVCIYVFCKILKTSLMIAWKQDSMKGE